MIRLIGLGPGDSDGLSRGAEKALRQASALAETGAGSLYLRTQRHPCVDWLAGQGLKFQTFDKVYDTAQDFASVYQHIAATIISEAVNNKPDGFLFEVAFAVPGHPLFGEESVRLILQEASAQNIPCEIISSSSFVEAALTAVGASLGDGCDIRDALTLQATDRVDANGHGTGGRIDTTRGLLLFQVFDTASASHAKLALMRDYPDDWQISIIRAAGSPALQSITTIPLYRLDREPVDHLTSVYIPALPPTLRRPGFDELVGLMARLRAPDGCPWDQEQTHLTLKKYFIEETYEVVEAIDAYIVDGDALSFTEELGDALLQVVFHSQLAAEEGIFTIDDVCASIVTKLVRRHPHVFGAIKVADSAEVLRNWEQIKRDERSPEAKNYRHSLLDGVAKELPALMKAMEISKRAAKVGFEWKTFGDVIAKLDEEINELKAELSAGSIDRARVASELGDLLFTVVQIARWQKIDSEEALRQMLNRFTNRFQYIEKRATEQGREIKELTLDEMDALWEEAKRI